MNEIPALPDIETVRAELNVLGGNESPPADFVMPDNYYPATPIYSPASPVTINNNTDTESEHGFSPPQKDGPIITRGLTYSLCPLMILIMIWTGK